MCSSISAETFSTPGIREVPRATYPAQLWQVSSTMSIRSSVAGGAIAVSGAGGGGVRTDPATGALQAATSVNANRMAVLTDDHSALGALGDLVTACSR